MDNLAVNVKAKVQSVGPEMSANLALHPAIITGTLGTIETPNISSELWLVLFKNK